MWFISLVSRRLSSETSWLRELDKQLIYIYSRIQFVPFESLATWLLFVEVAVGVFNAIRNITKHINTSQVLSNVCTAIHGRLRTIPDSLYTPVSLRAVYTIVENITTPQIDPKHSKHTNLFIFLLSAARSWLYWAVWREALRLRQSRAAANA